MYNFEQHFEQEQSVPEEDDLESQQQPSYSKILQWSVNKLAAASGRRRTSSSTDLRRSLLIAGAMGKARAGILRQKAMQFLEDRPQLMPPNWGNRFQQQQQQQPIAVSLPQAPAEPEPEPELESAFGYSTPMLQTDAADEIHHDSDSDSDDDALSVSAEAIAMSSVNLLSIEEEPSPVLSMAEPQQTAAAAAAMTSSRKRKQQPIRQQLPPPPPPPPQQLQTPTLGPIVHSPAKRTRQLAKSAATVVNAISVQEPESTLYNLQASFVDLSMSSTNTTNNTTNSQSGSGCRQQASQFSSALFPCLPVGPECHAFA